MSFELDEPVACSRFRARGFRLIVARSCEAAFRKSGLEIHGEIERRLQGARPVKGGRGPNQILEIPGLPPIRVRALRRGGALGRILGDRFARPGRCEREFRTWSALVDRGAPVPPIGFALSQRSGVFWREWLGAANIEQATNLADWLQGLAPSLENLEPAASLRLERVATEVARAIRAFHDVGARHGDLHLGNVLIAETDAQVRVWLIDLDRTRQQSISHNDAAREVMRLVRSAEKLGVHKHLSDRVAARFLSAYTDRDRDLRRGLLGSIPREVNRINRHRLGWRFAARWRGAAAIAVATTACLLSFGCSSDANLPDLDRSSGEIALSLLATGDTGRDRFLPTLFEGQHAVAHAMVDEDQRRPVDGLVLLGDNFYPNGLEQSQLIPRLEANLARPYCHFLGLAAERSDELRNVCPSPNEARHPIPIYAVLGNHDLESPESITLQRTAIPNFVSSWRMSDGLAQVFELAHGVSLILFESELAIEDPEAIRISLMRALKRAQGPWRIIATHRPIATDDEGGAPLGGYPIWVRDAIADSGQPVQLVLAGHHHSLQAFVLETPSRLLQVGAGSGSRAEPPLGTALPESRFGELALGFARVDLVVPKEGNPSGADAHLVVQLFRTPGWPMFSPFVAHQEQARFQVDITGSAKRIDDVR